MNLYHTLSSIQCYMKPPWSNILRLCMPTKHSPGASISSGRESQRGCICKCWTQLLWEWTATAGVNNNNNWNQVMFWKQAGQTQGTHRKQKATSPSSILASQSSSSASYWQSYSIRWQRSTVVCQGTGQHHQAKFRRLDLGLDEKILMDTMN